MRTTTFARVNAVCLVICMASVGEAIAQNGPPVYAGAGVVVGNIPHMFPARCADTDGSSTIGPHAYMGLRFGAFAAVGHAAVIDSYVSRTASGCDLNPPDDQPFTRYYSVEGTATMLDMRALYTARYGRFAVISGPFYGSNRDLHQPYYGATLMFRYSSTGIALDYMRQRFKIGEWTEVVRNGTPRYEETGSHNDWGSGFLIRAFVEPAR